MAAENLDLEALKARHRIVGRTRELEALLACLAAGRHVLLEGPVGVGKTVLARAVGEALGRGVQRVDGDGRYTEQKLVGQFDPPAVMRSGYHLEAFLRGPLIRAMEEGAILFINEINRMPEGVQNVLLPALDEGMVVLPQLGQVVAAPGFSVIATMNPREFVATGHLSEALMDRFELITLEHQSFEEEVRIVALHARPPEPDAALVAAAVGLVRATREHPRIRRGASVRAAIALVEIARQLGGIDALERAAALALPTRIELKESQDRAAEVLAELAIEKKKPLKRPGEDLSNTATMRYDDDRDRVAPYLPMPEADTTTTLLPVGWDAATEYHRLKRVLPSGPLRTRARESAISAVLEKAAQCIRHAARPTRVEEAGWLEAPGGDLDLDASLDAGALLEPADPERLRVTLREARRADIVLILDMSLSMTGEKIALVAVAAAILALKLHMDDLGVVVFDSTATVLKRLGEVVSPREFVRRILEVPAKGYTNLEGGMREGLVVLRSAQKRQRAGVLMTDGLYNVGWEPSPLAPLFPRLHVIQLEAEGSLRDDRGLCRQLAASGRGRYYRADQYEDLPAMTYRLVQDLFR